jgi:hypothetical protein
VDYVVGLVGSIHDSTAFATSRISDDPNSFFSANEWMWADSAYPCRIWCIPPFKRPAKGRLTAFQKKFNYFLSTVCFHHTFTNMLIKDLKIRVRSEHLFGSLKGRFASLRELRFQIQDQRKFNYVNLWIRCCFILHNLIIRIEKELGVNDTTEWARNEEYLDEGDEHVDYGEGEEEEEADHNDAALAQGKAFREYLAGIAQGF